MTATVLEALNSALHQALAADERVVLIGEDLLDPYGGAFKVSRGLSEKFPERVFSTPISEAGFTGAAIGMALRGLRPVVEIMFGDFLTLAADQLINHAAKFGWMYAGNHTAENAPGVPMVVRTPMGGRRGYGPTHSQTLEKHFIGTPGLHVLAPCALDDPGGLLLNAVLKTRHPVLFVENKLLYTTRIRTLDENADFDLERLDLPDQADADSAPAPAYRVRVRGAPPPNLTLAAYGYGAELALEAALRLAYDHEVFSEVIVPTRLSPVRLAPIVASVERTGRLVTVEEGAHDLGWGAEAVAGCAEALDGGLRRTRRIAAANLPVPASGPLESAVLPSVEKIIETCLDCLQNR